MRVLAIFILALAAGCSFEIPEKRFRCDADHPCPPGQECVAGLCELPGDGPQTCPPLDPPDNGNIVDSTVEIGGTVSYECDDDFVLVGSETRTCTAERTWTGDEPSCTDACPAEAPACDLGADIAPVAGCLAFPDDDSMGYRVTEIILPTAEEAKGFDLDCFHTTASDAFGCYRPDHGEGIDNAFAVLASLLGPLGIDVNAQMADAIGDGYSGELQLRLELREHNGMSDDDCVVVALETFSPDVGAFVPSIEPLEGVIQGGVLKLVLDTLPFVFPIENENGELILVPVNITRARVELPIYGSGDRGIIGGHILWDSGSGRDLKSLMAVVVESVGGAIDLQHIENIIVSQLDMAAEGASEHACDCRAMSIGIEILAQPE